MEEEVVDIKGKSFPTSSLPLTKDSGNQSFLFSPIPEPRTPSPSSCSPSPPPPGSAVHALQSKVKALSQRRPRGRDREREDRPGPDFQSGGVIPSQALIGQKGPGRGKVSPPAPSRYSNQGQRSSSSEEEEVETRLQLHAYQTERDGRGFMVKGAEKGERGCPAKSIPGQPRGLGEGASLENLQSDSTGSTKEDPPPPSASSSSSRHWAPPKGFWRVARPETLLLNGVGIQSPPSLVASLKDIPPVSASFAGPQWKQRLAEAETGSAVGDMGGSETYCDIQRSDSLESYLERCEQKETRLEEPIGGLWRADSWESVCSRGGSLSLDERVEANQRARGRSLDRRGCGDRKEAQSRAESLYRNGVETNKKDDRGLSSFQNTDWDLTIQPPELEPYPRSLFINDDIPLSPRHEQAKRLLERARLKAQSNQIKGERPTHRSHSDQRHSLKRQQIGSSSAPLQKSVIVKAKEEQTASSLSGPLLVPQSRDHSPGDRGGRSRRHGHSPTRVRFEDESEKEAESRYLDRLRERGRAGHQKSKGTLEKKVELSFITTEASKGYRTVSTAPQRQEDFGLMKEAAAQEVVVRKCEACGSILRDPPVPEPQTMLQPSIGDEQHGKAVPRWVPPGQSETVVRPKVGGVTFAGSFVLGEDTESGAGERTSGFGKLRRRSRKGESRLESGNGPYGHSWAQRRNSNPRNRVNVCRRAVTFAPGSPVALERPLLGTSGNSGLRDTLTPPLPIKSALKSGSKSRVTGPRTVMLLPSVQCRLINLDQEAEGGSQHLDLDSQEPPVETQISSTQGSPLTTSLVPCIRPSSLRYSPARLTPDLPPVELWDTTAEGAGLAQCGDVGRDPSVPPPECRLALRCLGVSRAEDLRAELLRAEHLKAEALWEDGLDGARRSMAERDGRPKLSLRRFFSSIGLNSVSRLVKGGRSSSMEQLCIPAPRASSTSPSPTHRSHPIVRLQRTPSLQALNTVSPLAQLRKASSVQSLERRAERSTILGELPYSLAPRELQRAVSVENVLAPRVVRPVGRVTQAFPDRTLLLELTRPPNGPFGFLISRGKGRPDTGVYIEQVGDSAGEGLYSGLLGVGDEILEVNREAVAGLTLDQVTRLMTRDSTASIRILPYRRNQR